MLPGSHPRPTRSIARSLRHGAHNALLDGALTRSTYLRSRARLRAMAPGPQHDVLIEGYPRSANTYAVAAFQNANPQARVASHLHSWRSVREAVALKIPSILLIRDPIDAVASLLVFMPGLSAEVALRRYIDFYERCEDYQSQLTVGAFRTTVSDFGVIISALNSKTGRDFAPYVRSIQNEQQVRARVEAMGRAYDHGSVSENRVARPSMARSGSISDWRAIVAGQTALVEEAQAVFHRVLRDAVGSGEERCSWHSHHDSKRSQNG